MDYTERLLIFLFPDFFGLSVFTRLPVFSFSFMVGLFGKGILILVTLELSINPFVDLPRKRGAAKRYYLSFNIVRGLHYLVYNQIKKSVHADIVAQLSRLPTFQALHAPVAVTCTLWSSGERKQDLDNLSAVVKFVTDAVVATGWLEDDSTKYIKSVTYLWGGVDKGHPRYDITYNEI